MHGPRRNIIIAHHLILHGYGHWFPNDPRGSGSSQLRHSKFSDLGPVHFGRKRVQPSRVELLAFLGKAQPRLEFPRIWFDNARRQAIGDAIRDVVTTRRYTVWACAVLKNHVHLCVRRRRDDALAMWHAFAEASRASIRRLPQVVVTHPVWSERPYKVFLDRPEDVNRIIRYIKTNPTKERLRAQIWPFVTEYDGWPYATKTCHRDANNC